MRIRSIISVGLVAGLALTGVAVPAQASSAPKPGSSCGMSGESRIVNGRVFVCEQDTSGNTWSQPVRLKRSASRLQINDQWVRAQDSGMTGGFGIISNPTNKPIRVIAARSPRFAGVMQLHDVVMKDGVMTMEEKSGGFVVPARGSLELKPGGDHLMFMRMRQPIKAGEMVPVLLITADGHRLRFEAMGRVFAGGNEPYNAGHGGSGHGGMN